jgi:hypothetical protein
MKSRIILALAVLFLSGCEATKTPDTNDETVEISSGNVLFSEVMAGIEGNNNYEFIELYNPSDAIADLNGLSLWYRLSTSDEDLIVYRWTDETPIPGHGHYLLSRQGQDLGILANASFNQSLNAAGGGLILRDSEGQPLDGLGWGNAPLEFTETAPAAVLENGNSLERYPGGVEGNALDSDDNSADFYLSSTPNPENTGSALTPEQDRLVALSLSGPERVEPGSAFSYTLTLSNLSDDDLIGLVVELGLPPDLAPVEPPGSMTQEEQKLYWSIPSLQASSDLSETLALTAPWLHGDYLIDHLFVKIDDPNQVVFANPHHTAIEGGTIPIGTARGLIGAELTVEGYVTMYTGGYFAGSGNVKFYVEDESGGLQVQVFGGEGEVSVPIGAQVRVTGTMGVYRDSLQIVPNSVPGDIEIIDPPSDRYIPDTPVSVRQAANDFESLPGRLIQVEGMVDRVEEFTYDYEMDIADDEGQILQLYIDKLTEMSVETIEPGSVFRCTGILEVRDGILMLYPRLQSDLEEVFPPVLMLEIDAPNTVLPGESFDVSLITTNYSPDPVEDITIAVRLPLEMTQVAAVYDDGRIEGNEAVWSIPSLGVRADSVSVGLSLQVLATSGRIQIESYTKLPLDVDVAEPEPWGIFIGNTLPIWAVQGDGLTSPYVLDQVRTTGVVTGVFPSLGGFWIQSLKTDNDPNTSEGLFVFLGDRETDVTVGDYLDLAGVVREISQQTLLEIESLDDINILDQGLANPEAIELSPPLDDDASLAYYETLEGMLVQVSEPAVAVSPTSRYGEYSVVLLEHGVDRIWRGAPSGYLIMVDDGTSDVHNDSSTLEYVVQTGDHVSDLFGPLAFTFGHYKIEPLHPPSIQKSSITIEELPPLPPDQFSVMTWNVENLFDILEPHPADPPLPRKAEYELSLTKIASTILAAGVPTIVGLQEVENVGILEDLVEHPLLQQYAYHPVLIEGTDSRGIDVGYLVREDRGKILDVEQYIAPEGLTSRPPLLLQVELDSPGGTFDLSLLNNHFTSMSGGVQATEPRRTAQAAWNVTVLQELLGSDPTAYVAILGDLNSFYDSKPIDELRNAGLEHVFDILEPAQRYTYIFEGASQSLDHILVTHNLMELIEAVDILHLDADFPPADPDDPSPIHKSDHDPVIARFRFPEE